MDALKKKFSLFIVDDSKIIIEKIQDRLTEMENIEIIGHALNGLSAMSFINKTIPDIIILDINMPGFNGLDVLLWLRNRYSQIKVIMLSNHNTVSYKSKCSELGTDYFIDKSTEFELLPGLLRTITTGTFAN